ncbi:aldose epimerase family protein [Hyphococcus sp.]|uniref:aldose epimerase family protein n=1 Tax=Hyphococcus sp. TaxID=2038636 RepID=UPI0035C6D8A6
MTAISAGKIKAVLAPDLGGAVMSLSFEGKNIFRPASSRDAVAVDPREAACYPCVPWFSRLFGGLDFGGRHYELAPTLPACDPDHALHGHGWVNPWTITDQREDHLTCRFDHAPAPGLFPFRFFATQEFSVSQDAFQIVLSLTNDSSAGMPAGLGLHPFFPNTKTTELNFTEYFGQPKLPSALTPPEKIDHRGPVTDDPVDYTVKRWDGTAEIVHDGMKIAMRSNARILHLYSPEDADFYCAEPVSHWPGHFGQDILAPQETMDLVLSLKIIKQAS